MTTVVQLCIMPAILINVGAKVDVIDNHGKLPADHSPNAELKEVFKKLFVSKSSH